MVAWVQRLGGVPVAARQGSESMAASIGQGVVSGE